MEVFRKLDGLAEEIQRSQPPVELWRKFLYCTFLYGSILGQSTICNPKICEQIIFKLIGRELGDINVIDIKPWVMHAEVAEKFLSCGNRIILAGNAAHRFPPAGGFGMNSGLS